MEECEDKLELCTREKEEAAVAARRASAPQPQSATFTSEEFKEAMHYVNSKLDDLRRESIVKKPLQWPYRTLILWDIENVGSHRN